MSPVRAGHALPELLVALPLLALAGALAGVTLVHGWRVARRQEAAGASLREMRHALGALASELRPAAPAALHHWSDTLLEFSAEVGRGVACTRGSSTGVVLAPAHGTSVSSVWREAPSRGDGVHAWTLGAGGVTLQPAEGRLAGTARAACSLPILRGVPGWEVVVAPGGWAGAEPGLPVVVTRRVRYRLYRGVGGWYLGRQAQLASGWETVQPVAGPLRSATEGGLRVRAWSDVGQPLAMSSSGVRHLQVLLRTPAVALGGAEFAPSVELGTGITLRGGRP